MYRDIIFFPFWPSTVPFGFKSLRNKQLLCQLLVAYDEHVQIQEMYVCIGCR